MAYYRRIRDLREDHDLTQRQLASLLHMPQPQYNRYEQGLRDIPPLCSLSWQTCTKPRPIICWAAPTTPHRPKPSDIPV